MDMIMGDFCPKTPATFENHIFCPSFPQCILSEKWKQIRAAAAASQILMIIVIIMFMARHGNDGGVVYMYIQPINTL